MKIKRSRKNILILLHMVGWLVAQFIYVPLGISGDQPKYAVLGNILNGLGGTAFLPHLVFGSLSIFTPYFATLLATIGVAWAINSSSVGNLSPNYRSVFWVVNSLPHFLIWSSIASKEAIYLIPAFLFVSQCIRISFSDSRLHLFRHLLLLLCIESLIMLALRPEIGFITVSQGLATILLTSKSWIKLCRSFFRYRFSLSLSALVFIVLSTCFLAYIYFSFAIEFSDSIMQLVETSRSYFLYYDANTNRDYILFDSAQNFVLSAAWGIPLSLIGVTVSEAFSSFKFFLLLLEGMLFTSILIFAIYKLYSLSQRLQSARRLLFCIYIPSVVLLLIILYPFGIYNIGSSVRYKMNLVPPLLIYPIYLCSNLDRSRNTELRQL